MMFSESRNDRRRRISDRAAADRLRDRDNASGIATTPRRGSRQRLMDRDNASGMATTRQGSAITAEIGDDTTGIVDIAAKVIPC